MGKGGNGLTLRFHEPRRKILGNRNDGVTWLISASNTPPDKKNLQSSAGNRVTNAQYSYKMCSRILNGLKWFKMHRSAMVQEGNSLKEKDLVARLTLVHKSAENRTATLSFKM